MSEIYVRQIQNGNSINYEIAGIDVNNVLYSQATTSSNIFYTAEQDCCMFGIAGSDFRLNDIEVYMNSGYDGKYFCFLKQGDTAKLYSASGHKSNLIVYGLKFHS